MPSCLGEADPSTVETLEDQCQVPVNLLEDSMWLLLACSSLAPSQAWTFRTKLLEWSRRAARDLVERAWSSFPIAQSLGCLVCSRSKRKELNLIRYGGDQIDWHSVLGNAEDSALTLVYI